MRLDRLTALSLRFPVATLAATALLACGFSYGMGRTTIENGFRSYLGDNSPELKQLTEFIEQFGGGVPLIAVYDCFSTAACTSVFDDGALEMAHRMFEELRSFEGVSEVYTPADSRLLVPVPPDDFETHRLYANPRREELAALASTDPLWDRTLVAQNGQVGAVVVQFETADPGLQRRATMHLKRLTDLYADQGFTFRFVGESVDFTLGTEALKSEQDRVMPWLMLAMCVAITATFRSLWAVIPAMITMTLATVSAQGLMGLLSVPVDATTQNVLSVVLVVGICDAIHFLSRYASTTDRSTRARTNARAEQLTTVANEISVPCFWTTATTVVAFLSFLTSDFQSFRYFGLFCSFGVLVALLATFTVLPIVLSWLPGEAIRSSDTSQFWARMAGHVSESSRRNNGTVLALFGLALLVSLIGIGRVRLDTNITTLMGSSNPLIEWSDWIEENLRSPESLEIEIILAEGQSITDPAALSVVRQVEQYLSSSHVGVGPVRSILNPIRRLNHFLQESDGDGLRLPGDALQLSDIFALIDRETKDQWVSIDRRHIRLSAEASSMSTSRQRAIVDDVKLYLQLALPNTWSYRITGSVPIFEAMMGRLLKTQVKALAVACFAVLICLLIYFRLDFKLAALAMLPNVFPVAVVLGFVGLAGIPLDVGIVIVGPMIIGVAVDDTIHLFSEYRTGTKAGLSSSGALRGALELVQRPVVTSSLALCAGFLTLSVVTRYGVIQTFGVVLSLAIVAALAADLLLVPALIQRFPRATSGKPNH